MKLQELRQLIREEISKVKTEDITSKLDKLGVKYKLSNSPHKLFDVIYKPTNKPDSWYDKFNKIIDLYHLKSVVKTQPNI